MDTKNGAGVMQPRVSGIGLRMPRQVKELDSGLVSTPIVVLAMNPELLGVYRLALKEVGMKSFIAVVILAFVSLGVPQRVDTDHAPKGERIRALKCI